jgi:divalent metal cation (Fe/Co/Zn/Cd) transporter
MTDKPRYSIRENSAALSRLQWWIVGVATLVAGVGGIGKAAFGWMLMGLAALIIVFTVISAAGRGRQISR